VDPQELAGYEKRLKEGLKSSKVQRLPAVDVYRRANDSVGKAWQSRQEKTGVNLDRPCPGPYMSIHAQALECSKTKLYTLHTLKNIMRIEYNAVYI
jgi:hypothetical protein